MTSRGIRLNNPGNIRLGDDWKGKATQQVDDSFTTFTMPEFGIRAMTKILTKYVNYYGLNTVRKIIGRWAPPNENATDEYVSHVAKVVGVKPDEVIDINNEQTLAWLIKGIIKHENGEQPYSDDVIERGIQSAKI